MEMGTHWLRLADRNWQSCKISHAVKRKGHFVRSSGFAAQNPVRVANHSKADVFFDGRGVCHMKSRWCHSETTFFGQSWAGARSAGFICLCCTYKNCSFCIRINVCRYVGRYVGR